MAGTDRDSAARLNLRRALTGDARRFSFFQAARLWRRLREGAEARENGGWHVRPELSFGFPACDISDIEIFSGDGGPLQAEEMRMTVSFLGLYGTSSPLPSFYTEDLFTDAREDSSAARDFLDIIHQQLFTLLFEVWKKHRFFMQVAEDRNPAYMNLLFGLSGMSTSESATEAADPYLISRYAGLLGRRPRSALGLKTILSDHLEGVPVEVVSCIPHAVAIPPDQRLYLGSDDAALGANAVIGQTIIDRQGKFRIRLGPMVKERFRALLGEDRAKLCAVIDRYLSDPLEYDFELLLSENEIPSPCLGSREWSQLGLDTALYKEAPKTHLTVVTPAHIAHR